MLTEGANSVLTAQGYCDRTRGTTGQCSQDGRRLVPPGETNMLTTAPPFPKAEQVDWGKTCPGSKSECSMHISNAYFSQSSETHKLQESSMISS